MMKIEDIYNITGGSAANTPHITAINSCSVFPSKIREGDLFFAACKEDIATAVQNGAYAIVYEGDDPVMEDGDIAWIRTDSVKDAAFKYLRYALLSRDADFYCLNQHEMSFLKMVVLHKKNIVFLPNDWAKAFETIVNSKQYVFVGSDEEILKTITPDLKYLNQAQEWYMISDTLFRSTFKTEGYVYQSMEIVPFHLEHLMKVVKLCKNNDLPFSYEKLKYTPHFMPIFVDGQLKAAPKGSSSKVIIFTDNTFAYK
jgi:ferrochelatase